MIFNTPWFLAFFLAFYLLLILLPGARPRFYFVLAMSAVFHAHFAGPAGVAPIVVMAAATYLIGARVHAASGRARRRWYMLGLAVPVAALISYKYRGLLLETIAGWHPAAAGLAALDRPLALPLAISFFTFEFVHYLTDIYHGSKPMQSPLKFALFCIYFPSIVSGPIKRYEDFESQIGQGLKHPLKTGMAAQGAARVLLGFFMKMVVADNAALLIGAMEKNAQWGPSSVAALMLLLSVRILFDFSGYSEIAIGLSAMIGLRLPENFRFPYLALNPSDFWRRWHISLSSWIRDYIYIPLGGSRQGALRRTFNSLAAMGLCGLWHGAAWNFMAWGVYHGCGLVGHAALARAWPEDPRPGWPVRLASMGLTFAFVSYGWLLFFYPLDKALFFTRALFGV